jgi:drug/metabolite transporter (DMT)-like permease
LGRQGLLALALGFAGVALVASDGLTGDGSFGIVGVLYVLLAALGVAVGNVLLKKLVKRFDPLTALGGQFALGSLPLWAGTIALEDLAQFRWSGSLVLVYVALVVLGTVIPAVLWFALLEREDLNRMNAFTFLTPIFALLLGAAFFDERLAALQWVGTVLVLAAVVLSVSFRSMERIAARLRPTP